MVLFICIVAKIDESNIEYRDHRYGPQSIIEYTKANNIYVPELTFELIVGRWIIDIEGKYEALMYDYE